MPARRWPPSRPHAWPGRGGALLAGAGLAGLLSLALPWSSATMGSYLPGWYVPGMCTTVYDNDGWPSMDCTPGYLSPGMVLPGVGAASGHETVARVFVVAAAILALLAWRRCSAALARAALLVAGAGLLLGGLLPLPGQVAYLAGMVLLALALRSRGLLPAGLVGFGPSGWGRELTPERRHRLPAATAAGTPPPAAAPGAAPR